MRTSVAALALFAFAAGCAELGVVSDGTSISVGRTNHGYLLAGVRLPDNGEGFTTREVWARRGNRYGTDEMVDLITGVARRMHARFPDVRLVVADLSENGGGAARQWHASHQSGRDADLLYYMRDASGQPFEPDAMHKFNRHGVARDGSGLRIDVPRMWLMVKELVNAPEANVQYIFMYEPIAEMLLDHARKIGEPADVILRARMALLQPGDSAPHNDHFHVRIYCSDADLAYGCVNAGRMQLLAQDEAHRAAWLAQVTDVLSRSAPNTASVDAAASTITAAATVGATPSDAALRSLLRTRADRIDLWHWR